MENMTLGEFYDKIESWPSDTINFECEDGSYTPDNGYLIRFIARNQNEEVKHIFG